MLKFHLNKRILIGFFLALAILCWLAVYSYFNTHKLISTSQSVADTQDVLFNAQRLLTLAVEIEVRQRGFTLTGNEIFLEPFNKGISQIKPQFYTLRELTKKTGTHNEKLERLASDIDTLVAFSSSVVQVYQSSREAAMKMNASLTGKKSLDRIREVIITLEEEEKALLDRRIKNNETQLRKLNFGFIALLFVTGLIVVFLLLAINVNLEARNETEKRLIRASEEIRDLYDNAPCGYHSLDNEGYFVEINKTLMKWLGYENKSDVIGKLNVSQVISPDDLNSFREKYPAFKEKGFINNVEFNFRRRNGTEFPVILSSVAIYDENGNFVKSRSNSFDNSERKMAESQITNLNKELEAFTYSVSHDLRAPLRSIDGYARILYEDYQEKLDAEGKRLINVIVNNAKRMGKLIDDLLDFSRLGRKDIQWSSIDMTGMVNSILSEFIEQEAQRKIEVVIHPLERADGDIDMIRQVWVNLISNAIKYTGKKAIAKIDIQSAEEKEEIHYSIADNGVGFDMQYSGKLFGVFQRLHRIQDFTGTGVGLAIVKRIITRHNGRVWAEGQVDKGATFHFTIPKNNGK
jgi:PAS domain S-box-containing protein